MPFYQNQNATSRPFYQNRRNNFQKKPYAAHSNYAPHGNYSKNPNRDQSQSRIRKSEEGNWLGHPIQNEKKYQNSNEQLPHKKETPTQTVINGQSDEESKKLCLKIVGQIRKLKQDNDILSKNKEDLFKDREERSLREYKDIQIREELEVKVINMITLTRVWYNEIRTSTIKIANERATLVKQDTHEDLLTLREKTQDETASLLLRAQAQALKIDLETLLSWTGFNSLDELRGTEELIEYNRMELRLQAMTRPLDAELAAQSAHYMGELVVHGLKHGFINNIRKSDTPSIAEVPPPNADQPATTEQTDTDDDEQDDQLNPAANLMIAENDNVFNNDEQIMGTPLANGNRLANTQFADDQTETNPPPSFNPLPQRDRVQSNNSSRGQGTSKIPTSSPAVTRAMETEKKLIPFKGKSLSIDDLTRIAYKDQKCAFCNVPLNFNAIKNHVVTTHQNIVSKYNLSFL